MSNRNFDALIIQTCQSDINISFTISTYDKAEVPYTESYLDIAKQSVSTAWCQVHEHEWNLKYIVLCLGSSQEHGKAD